MTLRFSTPIEVPDIGDITRSQVALRVAAAVSYEEYLTENGFGTFEIRDAIEVKMQPSDQVEETVPIDFTWEILSISEYEAQIQLHFELPESVSATSSDPDEVQVTIWAGDLFQGKNGKAMRPGLTITAPVVRQVNKDDYTWYKNLGLCLGYGSLVILTIGFFISNRM